MRHWSSGKGRRQRLPWSRRRRGSQSAAAARPQPDATPAWRPLLQVGSALLLALAVLLLPAADHSGEALAWTLSGRTQPSAAAAGGKDRLAPPSSAASVQEVAPPLAVQQLNEALAQRQPRISILEPADGALLGAGPWTLRLRVEDWPLVDAGPLGLGPHLLVQLDDTPPIRLLQTSLELPPLSPGSHRLTVMAARPWGEVVKRPGSFQQIRLHRVAPNPLSLPAPGTPQLLATAPLEASPGEPLLLDWLLLDAPLQNLRADDARWRLRVSVNGDSFLVEQATPLWLRGWKRGSNALLLELVDGRGEPLNPPFNSLVREVRLDAGAARPAWLGGRLPEADVDRLLGLTAPEAAPSQAAAEPEPALGPSSAAGREPPAGAGQDSAAAEPQSPPLIENTEEKAEKPQPAEGQPPASGIASGEQQPRRAPAQGASEALEPQTAAGPPTAGEGQGSPPKAGATEPPPPPAAGETQPEATSPPPAETAQPAPQSADGELSAPVRQPESSDPAPEVVSTPTPRAPAAGGPDAAPGSDPAAAAADRAEAPRLPAARDEVNPDGTLIRPQRGGPLQALRERLQR